MENGTNIDGIVIAVFAIETAIGLNVGVGAAEDATIDAYVTDLLIFLLFVKILVVDEEDEAEGVTEEERKEDKRP